jgi:hypothetical protein
MTTAQVNYLNIGFMILSCIVAFVLPFELFLFSYAVLGPLHYLTEMSWLQKRQFFTPGKRDYLVLAAMAFVIMFPALFKLAYSFFAEKDIANRTVYSDSARLFLRRATSVSKVMIFVTFATAATIVLVRNRWKRIMAVALIIVFGLLFRSEAFITIIFALFLPTLIHVFIFTGAFILLGAMREKSGSGYLSLLIFAGCATALLLMQYTPPGQPGRYVIESYEAGFAKLNRQIFDTFLHRQDPGNDIYFSGAGLVITRFIAYAYTYHYLNWFSKTTVIKWHLVSTPSLVVIVLLWAASLILYLTNYRTGLAALYFLSLLHVIFEFPLNIQSFRDISRMIIMRR